MRGQSESVPASRGDCEGALSLGTSKRGGRGGGGHEHSLLSLKSIKFLEIISNCIFLEQKSECSFKMYPVVKIVNVVKIAPISSFVLTLHLPM